MMCLSGGVSVSGKVQKLIFKQEGCISALGAWALGAFAT